MYDGISGGGIEPIDEVTTNRFNRFDAGLTIGLGGKFKIQRKLLLTIEPRYNLGLTNIINFEDPYFEGSVFDDGLPENKSSNASIIGFSGNTKYTPLPGSV